MDAGELAAGHADLPLDRSHREHAGCRPQHLSDIDVLLVQRVVSHLDLRHVEHVVDQIQQMPSARMNVARKVGAARVLVAEWMVADEFSKPDDGMQRRTQFMAHVRQEF